jgi:NAD(P)-dependent dehydrogenase (short-subunit alcohol dehydrogenase family)
MVSEVERKAALITGAARRRGIGRGIAEQLADEGCAVAINDIAAEDEAAELVAALTANGGTAGFYRADVSDRIQVEAMLDAVEADLGPVEIVVSNAGIAAWESFESSQDTTFDRLVAVNLTGAFNVGQAAARRMLQRGSGGRIVFTTSVHVEMPFPKMAIYGATKQALRALSELMAIELAGSGITVNHVEPGWVKSDLNDASPDLQSAAAERATMALIPAGRAAQPREIGRAVAYLCSHGADYVTGTYLRVDGGLVVGKH